MRVIHGTTVKRWGRRHPDAAEPLAAWLKNVGLADWKNLSEVRRVYPHADSVTVGSGRTAVVFNIRGNHYRLVTVMHFNRQVVYALKFMTHADYSKDRWKDSL